MSSDELWRSICLSLSPSLSRHGRPYRHLFALLRMAAEQRRRRPPPPEISLGSSSSPWRCSGGRTGLLRSRPRWRFGRRWESSVPLRRRRRRWRGGGGSGGDGVEVLVDGASPAGLLLLGVVDGGLVAELGLRLGDRSGDDMEAEGRGRAVVGVTVGVLRVVGWRYVEVDDGLMYLQHFISPP
ncbi:unnamed protein product [Spirodela intermedia]|uniref:Uncharacterized protein n=1 Tax=Spirodela intermedia TaxID=51605 RepID=A0A7I8IA87_SPIIN|nr:unnamed protein product [Spirodela intermedia]CAA6653952.1 unnamed protein product [Spirodela intermedia]